VKWRAYISTLSTHIHTYIQDHIQLLVDLTRRECPDDGYHESAVHFFSADQSDFCQMHQSDQNLWSIWTKTMTNQNKNYNLSEQKRWSIITNTTINVNKNYDQSEQSLGWFTKTTWDTDPINHNVLSTYQKHNAVMKPQYLCSEVR